MKRLAAPSRHVQSRALGFLIRVAISALAVPSALADETLRYQRNLLPRLLDQLAYSIPDGVALKSIRQNGDQVKVIGYAGSSSKVTTYARELERSDLQMSTEVANIRDSRIGASGFSEFSIELSPKDDQSESAGSDNACAALPPPLDAGRDFEAVLLAINNAGKGNSVEFELFRPGSQAITGSYTRLPTAIKVFGAFGDIRRFVHEINRLPTLITVNEFSIQETRDDSVRLEAIVTIFQSSGPSKTAPAVVPHNPTGCSMSVVKAKFMSDPFSREGL